MRITFNTKKLQKACNSQRDMAAKLGKKRAGKLQQRLMELRAADNLEDISHIPPARCHELKGNYKGYLSVDLDHPYRLLFIPDHKPIPTKPDGGLDWAEVTAVVIMRIEDTH